MNSVYDEYSPGTMFKSGDTSLDYWLKPEQNASMHIEGCLVNLFTGQILHHSRVGDITPVYGSEIMW